MKFIETDDGSYLAVDRIVRMSRVKIAEGKSGTRVELTDGTTGVVRLPWAPFEVMRMLSPIIPAAPGYETLETFDGDEVIRGTVIGWRVEQYGVTPITLDGVDESGVVKGPDGRVTEVECCVYPSEQAWVAEKKRATARRKA
jgi:hypothetical protein